MKKPITIDNYKKLLFSKIICDYYAGPGDDKNVYDILMPIDDELTEIEESTIYFNQLLRMFEGIKKSQREDFVDYQVKKYGTLSEDWMFEVYNFLDEYENDINAIRPKMANEFKGVIDQKLRNKKKLLSNLKWASSETDFVVLTKALLTNNSIERTDGKKLYQKELDLVFEQFLNVEIKYKKDLLTSAKRMKIESNNFITKLREAWQTYINSKLK
ncbi:hypothetical protein U0038_01835 [Sphingobacterium spiritivorum]|uniref:Uncharacterized protein n=1 Tax=Sphingobacterium spiritivorum ATCC 33861 TaxID=525373 RepID=D7VHV2_SPHSI|nr:hypothetical protein [Sphingobacterium spiritivorum]EFK59654.1 hypothetical protein HMPREF0766_10571 [Sphingobacterium spiritivorum ATCC 33861]QQT37690.1 hypothetical protein I6J01_09905 [Sphingobacterium spiritivorum]WQD34493.1 hypothetical protein U0038_01835 [Sphingobacterium spiritivorum]SUI97473.1 Uncharacterised protein [Sphingobacterium spiritivorum]